MDKSIEEIWNEGFQDDKILIPPIIIDLYSKKSILTVDKLKSTTKKDNWSIIPLAIIILFLFAISSEYILGLYVSSLMLSMFFLNKKRLKYLNTINTGQSCYQYLYKLQKMIKNNVKFYTRLLGIGFPFFVYIGFSIFILGSDQKNYILETYSLERIVIFSTVLLIIFSLIGISCYRLTNYLIYGRMINKIDEMVYELDLLKK